MQYQKYIKYNKFVSVELDKLIIKFTWKSKHARIINGGPFLQDNWDDEEDEKKEEAEIKPGKPLGFLYVWFYILVSIWCLC